MYPTEFGVVFVFVFLRVYLFICRQKGKVGEREGEKHLCVLVSHAPPTGDLACNPGMCPDWEWNQQPFCSQASAQSTEPHQAGLCFFFSNSHWGYDFIYFRESKEWRMRESVKEREREKHWCEKETLISCPLCIPQPGDQTHNPHNPQGMCTDWEYNANAFVYGMILQTNEPPDQSWVCILICLKLYFDFFLNLIVNSFIV